MGGNLKNFGNLVPPTARITVLDSQTEDRREKAIANMNAGHERALAGHYEQASQLYTQAIELLRESDPSDQNLNSLGAAHMNRGQLLHNLHGVENPDPIIEDYTEAIRILGTVESIPSAPWPRRNLQGTLVNFANLLLDLKQPEEAKEKAELALSISPSECIESIDTELTLLSYRSICDAIGQLLPKSSGEGESNLAQLACSYVSDGLILAASQNFHLHSSENLDLVLRLFRFGSRLVAVYKPEDLVPFLSNHHPMFCDSIDADLLFKVIDESVSTAVCQLSKTILNPGLTLEEQDQYSRVATHLFELHKELNPNKA